MIPLAGIYGEQQSDSTKKRADYDIPKRKYFAERISGNQPVIDGMLNDDCWRKDEGWQGDFTQREPRSGDAPTEETKVKILYDDNNLYVAIRCYDSEPEKIDRRSSRRDNWGGDVAGIAIDSYFDKRTAFEFDMTAAGVQLDAVPINDGTSWDMSWDAVWYGKTFIEDSAWTIEMQIPFSQLRYPAKPEYTWGLHVWRWINRKQEEADWQYIPKEAPGMVHLYGELHGIKGIQSSRKLEILPYFVGKLNTFKKEEGNPFATGRSNKFSGGVDGKVGITSNMTLDFTVNPDFGQVEADPSNMNLTAFETFYSEKRPFFVEGKNILEFGINDDDRLFYSRRIGHQPVYYPSSGNGEYVKMPEMTSILTALKLTGKTNDGLSLGFLSSLTAKENAEIDNGTSRQNMAVEPLSHYFVGRFQKEVNQGNTIFGGMLTAVNRSISDNHLKFLNTAAYTGGFDIRHQWDNKTYYMELKTIFSHIRGDKSAIQSAQLSPVRYFQRPDAGYLKYDTLRTSLSGFGGILAFGKEGNGKWRFSGNLVMRSPGLELNDIGYLRLTDIITEFSNIGYVVTTPTDLLLNYSINAYQYIDWNFGGKSTGHGLILNLSSQFHNFWSIWLSLSRDFAFLDTRILRGGPALLIPDYTSFSGGMSTDGTKPFSFEVSFNKNENVNSTASYSAINPGLTMRFSDRFNLSAHFNYNIEKNNLQYITTRNFEQKDIYLMGRIDRKTSGITFRVDYNITPQISVQYYGSPYITAGSYSNYKKILNPGADKYEDRFYSFSGDQINIKDNTVFINDNSSGPSDYNFYKPDFNFKQFRSNLVLRWEYKAGSTIYLVWSQGRTNFETTGEYSWRNDMERLYDVYPDDLFLIKLNHWFSF